MFVKQTKNILTIFKKVCLFLHDTNLKIPGSWVVFWMSSIVVGMSVVTVLIDVASVVSTSIAWVTYSTLIKMNHFLFIKTQYWLEKIIELNINSIEISNTNTNNKNPNLLQTILADKKENKNDH